MKKTASLIVAIMINTPVFAYSSEQIYCPKQIICKGTPESCYVDIPKNFEANFIYDTHQSGATNPNGRYTFREANYQTEAFCVYEYVDGTTDPHAAYQIIFENKIRMKPEPGNPWWMTGTMGKYICSSKDEPNKCPFLPKP